MTQTQSQRFAAGQRAAISISGIPAFNDNYIWLLQHADQAIVVDPGDPRVVLDVLSEAGVTLQAVLITHHHFDHVGGLGELLAQWPALEVYGPENPAIAEINRPLRDGDTIELFGELPCQVMAVPGHTLDHIAYYCPSDSTDEAPLLFCGDTLFAGGCGRIFEGQPAQMHQSLQDLAALPANTQLFCAHEYTTANLDFASQVEPHNNALQRRRADVAERRQAGLATVPSALAIELQTNPFLRSDREAVVSAALARGASSAAAVDVFACIRAWKDDA